MSILSDWEIKHLVEKENMIEPFVSKEVKEITNEESDTNPQTPNHKG